LLSWQRSTPVPHSLKIQPQQPLLQRLLPSQPPTKKSTSPPSVTKHQPKNLPQLLQPQLQQQSNFGSFSASPVESQFQSSFHKVPGACARHFSLGSKMSNSKFSGNIAIM
jgi:hypothetical protein